MAFAPVMYSRLRFLTGNGSTPYTWMWSDLCSVLPAGCTATPVGGEQYYYCGGNFYRAVFQGNSLVYVTAQPK